MHQPQDAATERRQLGGEGQHSEPSTGRLAPGASQEPPSAAAPLAIEAEDLTRRFGQSVAVEHLQLSVQRGEILGLVGPDGAGKTTTLRLLGALLNPSQGHVRVFGHDTVHEGRQIKRRIGYVAQRFSLYGDLSVVENILFFADLFAVPQVERGPRLERLLAFARLDEFRQRRAAHLSGGMQRKLALACVLIHTPDLILLDEPTTGVDPVSRREFWDILGELHLQGITLVISTPYMDEAEQCTRVGLMVQGRLLACDTPTRIKGRMVGELVALWPSDLRRAQAALADVPGLREVQLFGDQLRIVTDDADAAIAAISAALAARDVGVRDLRRTRVRMEEAFVSLIGQWSQERDGQPRRKEG
jgi:ABC-2 type transport system ATP-binding protein